MTSSSSKNSKSSSYQKAGVNLDAAEDAVERYQTIVQRTFIPGVMQGIGGFGGLFSLKDAGLAEMNDPVLVSATDGVGTKLKLAFELQKHDTIGIDCVAMCVNDVVTTGARPLFFLDYLATGQLNPDQAQNVVDGIASGCEQSQCALIGGETAEMPGFYARGEYDIAGFCVGIAERSEILNPGRVREGDHLIGIASSGCHSNGYSLIRKIIDDAALNLERVYSELHTEHSLGEILLIPIRIYTQLCLALIERFQVSGLAHITGGGFYENIPRILPSGLSAQIDRKSWHVPAIFSFLAHHGHVPAEELFHVFNMGVGMVAVIRNEPNDVIDFIKSQGQDAWLIGAIVEGDTAVTIR